MTEAYPLQWPHGKPRTNYREASRFRVSSFAVVRDNLFHELKLLGAGHVVLSTNIPLRQDGIPYANFKTPNDPGVAVYFTYKKSQMCFACDRWRSIEDNINAVQKTIEALRGIARWGTGDMLQAAFTGFMAIEAPKNKWWEVLGVPENATLSDCEMHYRIKARSSHPDTALGSHDAMAKLNEAIEQARKVKT